MKNAILESLPTAERQLLNIQLSPINLLPSSVLFEPGETPEYIYFPLRAMVSYLSSTKDGQSIEVGVIGNEGVVDVTTMFGDTTAFRAVVQIAGAAMRISRASLKLEFRRSEALREVLLEYANALFAQMAHTAVCNKFHSIESRFCRWLMVAHDYSGANALEITHDGMSRILGARRASVTIVAGRLQRAGAIRYSRGVLTITDRSILEKDVCECYDSIVSSRVQSNN